MGNIHADSDPDFSPEVEGYRQFIRWKLPDIIIDPDAPVDTPAGRRCEARAPSPEEWAQLHEEWKKLASEEE